MKKLQLLFVLMFTTGCTTVGDYNSIAHSKGAQAYDTALDMAQQFTCNDTSVGSIMRKYGNSVASMQRWIDYCFGDAAVPKAVLDGQ